MRGELETKQKLQLIVPPTLMAITAFLFPFSWAAQPGAWGVQPLWDMVLFQHLLSNWSEALNSNCSIGGPEGPLCWVLVLSTASYLQLTRTSCRRGYIIDLTPISSSCKRHNFALNSTPRQSMLYPDIPRPDATVIYTGAFTILKAWPGRRLNMQQYFQLLYAVQYTD